MAVRSTGTRLSRRGVALIMVLLMLVLLMAVGLSFINGARQDRIAGQAAANRARGDAAVSATVDLLSQQIADDYLTFKERQEADPLDPELTKLWSTYPDENRPWMAAAQWGWSGAPWDPKIRGRNNVTWSQISFFGEGFVNVEDPLGDIEAPSDPTRALDLQYQNVSPLLDPRNGAVILSGGASKRWTVIPSISDVSTEDSRSAKWQRLPIGDQEGLVWVAAVHVTDNGSQVNVNTATQTTAAVNHDAVRMFDQRSNEAPRAIAFTIPDASPGAGNSPAAVDLYGMFAKAQKYQNQPTTPSGSLNVIRVSSYSPVIIRESWNRFIERRVGPSWLTSIRRDPVGFINGRGLGELGTVEAVRREAWQKLGQNLYWFFGQPVGSNFTVPDDKLRVFGIADELALRLPSSGTSFDDAYRRKALTPLAVALSGPYLDRISKNTTFSGSPDDPRNYQSIAPLWWQTGTSTVSYFDPSFGDYLEHTESRPYSQLRRHLTTYNATRLTWDVPNDPERTSPSGRYRAEMPPWLDQADSSFNMAGSAGPGVGIGTTNPIPYFKLDPNWDRREHLASAFYAALSQTTRDAKDYGGTKYTARVAALQLAANLEAYRSGQKYDASRAWIDDRETAVWPIMGPTPQTGRVFFGVELQPFFSECMLVGFRREDAADADHVIDDANANETQGNGFIIELRNPWPRFQDQFDIDLSRFALKIGDMAPVQLEGTLKAGEAIILYSHPILRGLAERAGPAQSLRGFADGAPAAVRLLEMPTFEFADSSGQFVVALFALSDPDEQSAVSDVLAGGNLMVDRMRLQEGVADWRPVVAALAPEAADPADRYEDALAVAVKSIQRPSDVNQFFPRRWRFVATDADRLIPDWAFKINERARGGGAGMFVFESRVFNRLVTHEDLGSVAADKPMVIERASDLDGVNLPEDDLSDTEALGYKLQAEFPLGTGSLNTQNKLAKISSPLNSIPPFQIAASNGPLLSPAEVGTLMTVSHTDIAPLSENLWNAWSVFHASLPSTSPPPNYEDLNLGVTKLSELSPSGQRMFNANLEMRNLQWAQYASDLSGFAFLRLDEYYRQDEPRLPIAAGILEMLDTVAYGTVHPVISGRININTAPVRTIEALPYFSDYGYSETGGSSSNAELTPAIGMVAYRDKAWNYITDSANQITFADITDSDGTIQLPGRQWATGIEGREERGFAALSEAYRIDFQPQHTINRSDDTTYRTDNSNTVLRRATLRAAGYDGTPTDDFAQAGENSVLMASVASTEPWNLFKRISDPTADPTNPDDSAVTRMNRDLGSGPMDRTPDDAVDDMEERLALMNGLLNCGDLRSDVFTAHVVLRGMRKRATDSKWETAVERKFIAVIDRSMVRTRADKPKVIGFLEYP